MPTQLHIYRSPETDYDSREMIPEPNVRVRLGDLIPLVAMAQKLNFIWLKDFLDDEIAITEDLHEVLMSLRAGRPSA
jgi:hypothetical protein